MATLNELQAQLTASREYPSRPVSPRPPQGKDATPEAFREHAEALEAYDKAIIQFRNARAAIDKEVNAIFVQWQAALYDEEGAGLPKDVLDRIYDKAYEDGHSAGYSEVRSYFGDYVEFFQDTLAAYQKAV